MQHYTLRSYIAGFAGALLLTTISFGLVWAHIHNDFMSETAVIATILCLAIVQLFVQLIFFLHIGQEKNPRWNIAVFSSALLVICIVVLGTLWIMSNLNYNMMSSPQEMQKYLDSQDSL